MLVTRGVIGKTERDYNRLGEKMNLARRGGHVPMNAFRDDGFRHEPPGWSSAETFAFNVRRWVDGFTLDRQAGQDTRLVLWCEAAGMVPQLERVAHDYSIPVYSSGGFDSLTVKHDMVKAFSDAGADVEVLHVGDHDPSGVHMFGSLGEDIEAFIAHYGGDVEFTRLAVTPEHVERYRLPTAPPKSTDRRAFTGRTCQAEALDPKTLAEIVRDAIEARQDAETRQAVIEREDDERERLRERFGLVA